jgi:streptogramin lyase
VPRFATALIAAAVLTWATPASAMTPTTSEFHLGATSAPAGVASGPDGNLWFADRGTAPAIGRITTTGAVHEFPLGAGSAPSGIAAAPDGNLWFANSGAIGRITTAGSVTEFPVPGANATGIAAGPDGNLWFADRGNGAIGRITTSGSVTEFSVAGSDPTAIAAGPDGNLWFADRGNGAIGRITTSGSVQEFGSGLDPQGIAAGPDGNLWFTDSGAIGRITPAGHIDEFSLNAGSAPSAIAAGPDQALWFTDGGTTRAIGRVTTDGSIAEFDLAKTSAPGPGIVAGPDEDMWFTDDGATPAIGRITTPPAATTGSAHVIGAGAAVLTGTVDGRAQPTSDRFDFGLTPGYGASTAPVAAGSASASATVKGLQPATTYHYRLEATNPTDTAFGADATFATLPLPVVSALTIDHRVWRRGYRLALMSAGRRRPVGMTVSFVLNRAVPFRLDFFSPQRGRRQRGKCRAPTRSNRRGRRCTWFALAGSLSFQGNAGANWVRFQGRLSGVRTLKPGTYQLRVTASDPTYPTPSTRSVNFTIVKA